MQAPKVNRAAVFGFRVSEILASVPTLFYALAYLAMIPLFAAFYYMIPEGFFEQNIQEEASLQADYARIRH